MNRIDRLTAILIHLQTKRVVKAEEIAERFEMSLRTVYRDVKALMEAGVPIVTGDTKVTEKGKPFVRNICMAFDLRLKRNTPQTQLFSMTI
jgi:predicted DNA-binding transcriptional regulator YafY